MNIFACIHDRNIVEFLEKFSMSLTELCNERKPTVFLFIV